MRNYKTASALSSAPEELRTHVFCDRKSSAHARVLGGADAELENSVSPVQYPREFADASLRGRKFSAHAWVLAGLTRDY